jgi:hypothetical protein
VNRLTTGRRHVRAGSVHVTELISRQALRSEASARAGREDGLLEQAASRRESSRGAQFAKLTSLGAATLVLCAAVAMATMISHERAGKSAADRPALRITGDQALLPDELERTVPSAGAPQARVAEEPAPAPMPTPRDPVPSTTRPTATTQPTTTSQPPSTRPSPAADELSDVALVESFYELLPSDPDSAFEMLAPNLLRSTFGEFLDSWSTVRDIDVLEVREHADGVVAVIRMALDDGGAIRIEQLLTVADSPHWITGAQLLSAQRN